MLAIPYGIDPDETWELDFALARAEYAIDVLKMTAKAMAPAVEAEKTKGDGPVALELAQIEAQIAKAEEEVRGYVLGSGPVFTVGHIPNAKRAHLAGLHAAASDLPAGPEKSEKEQAWAEEVVRLSVKWHRNLFTGRARTPVPFLSENGTVAQKTIEAYQPIVRDLARAILASQRLDEARKNG